MLNRSELRSIVEAHGDSDLHYLDFHYCRYRDTLSRFVADNRRAGGRVLDVGAHWLHQATLWSSYGFTVSALDLPLTLDRPAVRSLAAAQGIDLYPEPDLERPAALERLPDSHFQVVLFTEILEHLTFNPVTMWSEVYRVLAPGGRIVITTPNYYALRSLLRKSVRFLCGRGGGLNVQSVLGQHTHAHHWKEYSAGEIRQYFKLLSPDLTVVSAQYVPGYYPVRSRLAVVARWIEALLPPVRPQLYVEVELLAKRSGIVAAVNWN